jgi:hypothetical protein
MLFSLNRHRPLFTVNPVLNDYITKNNAKYIREIVKDIEYKNQRKKLFDEEKLKDKTDLIIPSVFLLSLTTIIYYFYSKRS